MAPDLAVLVQTNGNKIFLFPAWPKEWDVKFKLYASQKTIVEGELINCKMTILRITPSEREKDIVVLPFRN